MNFLFIDESSDNDILKSHSVTALLVDLDTYFKVREVFFENIPWLIKEEPATIKNPEEFHGREFLPSYDEDRKKEALEALVNIMISNKINIFYVGYNNRPLDQMAILKSSQKYGLCAFGLWAVTAEYYKDKPMLPIVDYNQDLVFQISGTLKSAEVMRQAGLSHSISIENSHNIVEPVYGSSEHSIFLQLADTMGFIIRMKKRKEHGCDLKGFKLLAAELYDKLNGQIKYQNTIELNRD